MSCNRLIDTKNGIITAIFDWTIEPPNLPFAPLEALEFVEVFADDAILRPDESFDKGRNIFSLRHAEVRRRTLDFRNSDQTVSITLNPDASGSVNFTNILPSVQGSPNAIQFEVSQDCV